MGNVLLYYGLLYWSRAERFTHSDPTVLPLLQQRLEKFGCDVSTDRLMGVVDTIYFRLACSLCLYIARPYLQFLLV
jgi:hypothetical protein